MQMPGDFGLVYAPWSHSHTAGQLLDRAFGEVGVEHLTIPVVTGEQTLFRLCGGPGSPYFYTEGGWHFPPQNQLYGASAFRPRAARWFGTRDVVAEVCERAAKLGLALVFRIDLPAVRGVVEHAPQHRCRNAWGDELLSFGPCVCSSEFRELVRATLADLARYQPAGFELRNLGLPPLKYAEAAPSPLLSAEEGFVTCFCAGCRQIATMAGLDADAAARAVREAATRVAQGPAHEARERALHLREDEILKGYQAARTADLQRWLSRLPEAHAARRMFFARDADERVAVAAPELKLGPRWTNRLVASPAWLRGGWSELRGRLSPRPAEFRALSLPVWVPEGPGADQLVQAVSQAVDAGVEFFDFDGVEEAPADVVTWVKQAVRYARRG